MDITTKNMRALLINVLLGVAILAVVFATIGGGWSLAKYTGILPLKKAKKALVIDKTPITVEHVKAIGELVTATWYDEQVIIVQKFQYTPDSILVKRVKEGEILIKTKDGEVVTKTVEKETQNNNKKKNTKEEVLKPLGELVIIQDAHGRIGINMAKLKPENLVFPKKDGMPVKITLPALECLDFIMNPTDTEVFSESNGWNLNDLKKAMAPTALAMKTKMQNDESLFATARKSAQEVVTQLFRAAGYENVQVEFESDTVLNLNLPAAQ